MKNAIQNVYLKIEPIYRYSPVDPAPDHDYVYRQDCFRRLGHEDGTISMHESRQRMLNAIVYREYTDATFTIPDDRPLIASDISEPPLRRRVPGTIIYTRPGVRLRIHVLNGHHEPHSLHMHGIQYGIDSDGAFPFGIQNKFGVRSDQMCPGQIYTYQYDVTAKMIGAWVFHDHFKDIGKNVRSGLFGGLVVRDPSWDTEALEIPFFMHKMAGRRTSQLFYSGDLLPNGDFEWQFTTEGTYNYRCAYHPVMTGRVNVTADGPSSAHVEVEDQAFSPPNVEIGAKGTVHWKSVSSERHTVEETGRNESNMSYAINGRAFAGNTPVIQVESGRRMRWYVFNLDLSMEWHNFHPHASHWKFGEQNIDNRTIGPAEAFVVESTAPPVILPPLPDDQRPKRTVRLSATYPVHCHVEPHVMQGMVALVHATQDVQISEAQEEALEFLLPEDRPFECPVPQEDSCIAKVDDGIWETQRKAPVFAVHGALLRTGKVILWSGHAELRGDANNPPSYELKSAQYDPSSGTYTESTFGEDLFCSGMAFLPDGRLLAGGGANVGEVRSTNVFDPDSEVWERLEGGELREPRWYPTMVTMGNGRVAILSGYTLRLDNQGRFQVDTVESMEVLHVHRSDEEERKSGDGYWEVVDGSHKIFSGLYPGVHWLPSGELFFTRTGWGSHEPLEEEAAMFRFSSPLSGVWTNIAAMNEPDRKEGCSVILIDDKGDNPHAQVFVAGGKKGDQAAISTCEMIIFSDPENIDGWQTTAPMNFPRIGVSSVVLPDGRVMVVGGRNTEGRFDPSFDRNDSSPIFILRCEIYDPVSDTWAVTPPMQYPRQYHSVALLLPDGRVFTSGGVDASLGDDEIGNQQDTEIYAPAYTLAEERPEIRSTPNETTYGSVVDIECERAASIVSICLVSPCTMSHHTDPSQRYVDLQFSTGLGDTLHARVPNSPDTAPPGYYMIFVVDDRRVPSTGKFIRLRKEN